jgi:cell division septation protein DedD
MLNRIVAILVLIAAGILVSPLMPNKHQNGSFTEAIKEPPFPNQLTQNATILALKENNINTKNAKKLFAKYHTTTQSNSIESKKNNFAWVVQIGNFKDKINAFRLVNKLRSQGINAFIHQKGAAFGEETKVYIGPETKRDSAEFLATKLSKEAQLSGVVKSYQPLST